MSLHYLKNIFLKPRDFLFKNRSVKQTIFKNTLWLAIAEGIGRFLKLILIIYVARVLGATGYGEFTFALSFVSLFVIFSDFGLTQIIVREFAQDGEREKEFSSIFSLRIILSLGVLFLISIGSFLITPNLVIRKAIWILAVYILVDSLSATFFAFLKARQQMQYEATAKILEAVVVTGLGFFIMSIFPSVENLSYSYLFAALSALTFILIFFHFKIFPLKISFKKTIWKKFLSLSWPLGLAAVFATIYGNIDSSFMGYLGEISQTGWYNAAYKIIGVTLIPPALISQAFYPALSIAFKESKERLQRIWNLQTELMILFAVPLVVGGITLAPRIIDFIYDPSFSPSVLVFQLLIIMAGLFFICSSFSQILIVFNQQRKFLWVALWGAIINIGLNLALIPRLSLYGAAFTRVITQILILCLLLKFTLRTGVVKPLNFKFLLIFLGAGVCSTLMYFVISWSKVYNLNVLLCTLIGTGVYFVSFLGYKKLINKIFTYDF